MIKYGLISRVDAECIEATLNYICNDFPDDYYINIIEIGVYNGDSSRGARDFLLNQKRGVCYHAIDNEKDKPILRPFEACNLVIGNSSEVYNRFEDDSQHFVFVDGLHTLPQVIADFFCYSSKVCPGGYMCFHDTGKHLDPLSGWQGVGSKDDPDMCLGGVRKALRTIGLLNNQLPGWKLIFDEADAEDTGGGVCIFKKIKKWD